MKITETIFAQLIDADMLLESTYQAIAGVDPNYVGEMALYEQGVQALLQAVPGAECYLQAKRQALASNIRFAMWQGFLWVLNCFHNPVNKLLAQLDFEELCRESQMHSIPETRAAQQKMDAFLQTFPKDKLDLLDPISNHYAYLKTYGYKLAYSAGVALANNLLPLVSPGYVSALQLKSFTDVTDCL